MRALVSSVIGSSLCFALALMPACAQSCSAKAEQRARARDGVLTVSTEQHASWVRNFNPLLAPNSVRWPTPAGIYEPLLIHNTLKGEYVPWLATGYEWQDGNRKLVVSVRPGVKWSDGQPFTARDVAFTFNLLRAHKATDLYSVWKFLSAVRAVSQSSVEFDFQRTYVPGLFYIGRQPIVPEHKWKDIKNPVTYSNEEPVATGPFTVVKVFQNQIYELGKNPNYWQKGKPKVSALRFPAYPGNDQANLALIKGEIDWAGNFMPAIDRVYVAKNPAHHHYWFPLISGTLMLYTNTKRKPFDDLNFRKAISLAIDRELIVKVGYYNYTRPADGTALSDAYARWRHEPAKQRGNWVQHDPARAEALFDQAGYRRGPDGMRSQPDGTPLQYDVNVVTGWSDWVRGAQIIAKNLRKVGIDAKLKAYDFSAWFEKLQKGDFDLSLGWTVVGPTPYNFYRELMSSQTLRPLGQAAPSNWNRFASKEADLLFDRFELTADETEQRQLCDGLQMLFAEHAPAIPIVLSPFWGEYNTARFTGFPSKEQPYARLAPYDPPEYLLVLTELAPR